MDTIDQKLIAILRRNARASISELAATLDLARATVRNRIKRLLDDEEILGFTIILKGDATPLPIRGITMIEIEGRGTDRITRQLNGLPEVARIHSTSGRWDLIIEIGTHTLPELDAVLRKIRLIDGISNSETNLLMTTKSRHS